MGKVNYILVSVSDPILWLFGNYWLSIEVWNNAILAV